MCVRGWWLTLPCSLRAAVTAVGVSNQRLGRLAYQSATDGHFTLTLGGDHCVAIGSLGYDAAAAGSPGSRVVCGRTRDCSRRSCSTCRCCGCVRCGGVQWRTEGAPKPRRRVGGCPCRHQRARVFPILQRTRHAGGVPYTTHRVRAACAQLAACAPPPAPLTYPSSLAYRAAKIPGYEWMDTVPKLDPEKVRGVLCFAPMVAVTSHACARGARGTHAWLPDRVHRPP